MSKTSNPDVDFGFHATIPRLIRTEYKELTPVQKWLYVCLKDLCGEHGTCYRTIKVLSAETSISTGMLSESIPVLHKYGLIHGEKKRRSSGGKEVWHITIVDIWQANGKLHPTKRSHSEQTLENVHTVNEDVHSVNDKGLERSQDEQKRSLRETEEGSRSSITIEAVSYEEEGVSATASTPRALLAHDLENAVDEEDDPEATVKAKTPAALQAVSGSHDAIGKVPANMPTRVAARDRQVSPTAASMETASVRGEQTPGPGALPSAIESPQFGRSHGNTSDQAPSSLFVDPEPAQAGSTPPAATGPAQTSGDQVTGASKPKRESKKPTEVQLTLHEQEIKAWYEELRGVEILLSKRTVMALAALGKRKMSKDDFLSVTAILDSDKWFEEHKIGVDLFWIERQWENKIVFLRGHKKPLADKKKPANWVPADDDYSLAALAQIQAKRQGV